LAATLAIASVLGCQPALTTGGDIPVTADRLEGNRLTGLGRDVWWTFAGNDVVIDSGGRPIPEDVADTVLGRGSAPKTIVARWTLDTSAGMLRLTDISVDGQPVAATPSVPIRPAGQVRVTLGGRQYNLAGAAASGP
jgi:hypothetical protein